MSSSFKRKTYGPVKPVKVKAVKLKKPDIRELKNIYSAIAKEGPWQQIDNLCLAMAWWDNTIIWFEKQKGVSTHKLQMLDISLTERGRGMEAKLEQVKAQKFVSCIIQLEKAVAGYLKVPKLSESIAASKVVEKKHVEKKNSLTPRFQKLTDMLHGMFGGKLLMEVVPDLARSYSNTTGRMYDHTLNTIFYDKETAKSLQRLLIKEGVMALAIQEAYYWSRALALKKCYPQSYFDGRGAVIWAETYRELMTDFRMWAKHPKSPKTLIKKPKKSKQAVNGKEHPLNDDYNKVTGGEIVI